MRSSDVTVQVRDKNLVRKGIITERFLDFEAMPRFNEPTDWTIRLPKDHPMVPVLATPGSGIIVSVYGVEFFSGFTIKPEEVTNTENPDGSYTFRGKDDTALLFHALAFPQPSNSNPATQSAAYDSRTGNAESIMRGFVAANLVSGTAPVGRLGGLRNFIQLETVNGNKGTGPYSKSARFDNLGVLLQEVASLANLGFRLIQRGAVLRFEVYQPVDRSKLVRFSIDAGSLKATSLQISAPNVTRIIAGGRGEGTAREVVQRTTADSTAAEADWGLIIEEFVSYTNAESTAELQQTADERLIKDGFTAVAVKAIPAENSKMQFVLDWNLGDTVELLAYGQPTTTRVTGAVMMVNSERTSVGAAIGDLSGFDPGKALEQQVEDTARKVSIIERTLELSTESDRHSIPTKLFTDPPSSYPFGYSQFAIYSGATGWPTSLAVIETTRSAEVRTIQTITDRTTGRKWVRGEINPDVWGTFLLLANETDTAALDARLDALEAITELPGSVNLNSYATRGLYHQSQNADAASGSNYPVPYAGLLEVFDRGVDSEFVYQRYSTYSSEPAVYARARYQGTWSAWQVLGDDTGPQNLPTLQNSFTNGNGAAMRKAGGTVFVEGELLRTTAPTASTLAFTLPVGWRPRTRQRFVTWASALDIFVFITVDSNGNVSLACSAARTATPGYHINFSFTQFN